MPEQKHRFLVLWVYNFAFIVKSELTLISMDSSCMNWLYVSMTGFITPPMAIDTVQDFCVRVGHEFHAMKPYTYASRGNNHIFTMSQTREN